MKKTKVLIIGARGMLGGELVSLFSKSADYEVLGWDMVELDITNENQVRERLGQEKPNIIINAAAYNAVDRAEEDEKEFELAKKVNGEAPGFLAKAAKEINAVFVQYVTDYVFDGEKGRYKEDDKPSPISNYGISKALGEESVQKIGGKFYLIRISKLFGRPAVAENAKKSFFETMLNLAKTNKELKVVDGERSCFTYVPDLARATKRLVEEGYSFGIYHLVNEGAVTWYEGLKKCFEFARIKDVKLTPVDSGAFPRPAKRADSTVLLNTKFPKLRQYEEALKEWLNEK